MADYRELLRKALDALPDNTGANRRAVYEKARTALVAQLRAIEPPLPAREITTHRLALEDCIREVEHEATEKLLGRFRAVEEDTPVEEEAAPAPEPQAPVVDEPEIEPEAIAVEQAPFADEEPEVAEEPAAEPIVIADEPQAEAPEIEDEDRLATSEVVDTWPVTEFEVEPTTNDDALAPEADWSAGEDVNRDDDAADPAAFEPVADQPEPSSTEPEATTPAEDRIARLISGDADFALSAVGGTSHTPEEPSAPKEDDTSYATGSIEDIIASAERASTQADEQPRKDEDDDHRVIPFVSPTRPSDAGSNQAGDKHFLLSEADAEKSTAPLVDVHGRPLSGATFTGAPGAAMSSVREVDLEPGILSAPEVSDAQVAIDRAIAALDREAQGDHSDDSAKEAVTQPETAQAEAAGDTPSQETPSGSGPGALTIFLIISVLLLGGGGVAGFWAWREGYIDLNTVFAQGDAQPTTEVAEADPDPETDTFEDTAPAAEQATSPATNTTPDVPATPDGDATLPGEQTPSTETVTPSATPSEPEVAFEDRLPAEADGNGAPSEDMLDEPSVAITGEGAQSLLLEEQSGQTTGAVPYSGSVEWSRGTDELGNPTIVAEASIPARNLDVEVLIRRNADANLPASHLMEVNFTVAETFVGGSIANLPGVLLKDEELVQGQPLTGASARIVGNSFLFALSSASEIDVENNIALLSDRGWLDLAMVYGTGRRAIMTLEKGDDGEAIFTDVLATWSELDAAAAEDADAEPAADGDAGA